ncbi:hypothetical protein STEG23_010584 [Scotinomys teguina]
MVGLSFFPSRHPSPSTQLLLRCGRGNWRFLLRSRKQDPTDEIAKRANCEVAEASPWFITGGGLNIPDWEHVKIYLQKILRKKGTDNMPLVTFSIWRLVKDALLTDKVKVKEQLVEAEQSLEEIQEEERKSASKTDIQSEDEEESQLKTKAKKVKVKEFSSSFSSESDLEEEERLEQEIVDLERKRKKCKMKESKDSRSFGTLTASL